SAHPLAARVRDAFFAAWLRPEAPLVFAALTAAACRFAGPLVRAACSAASDRSPAVRCCAAVRACFESDALDAADVPSRSNARSVARDRLADGLRLGAAPCPAA